MSDLKDLEFLAERARELLDRQITSFRATHAKAGSIIAVVAIFVPLFLSIIEKSVFIIKVFSIIPIVLLCYSLVLMIEILRQKKLDQGFNESQFDKLVNKSYEDILLYEIGAKKDSFTDNQVITESHNRKFNYGLSYTITAIFLSFALLTLSIFVEPKKTTTMSENEKTENTNNVISKETTPDTSKTKDRVIPSVPKEERTQLNEGKDIKISSSKKLND
ncbi:MAG: hypothetical protein WCK18_10030 [Prolixibacteraceae bacterium]